MRSDTSNVRVLDLPDQLIAVSLELWPKHTLSRMRAEMELQRNPIPAQLIDAMKFYADGEPDSREPNWAAIRQIAKQRRGQAAQPTRRNLRPSERYAYEWLRSGAKRPGFKSHEGSELLAGACPVCEELIDIGDLEPAVYEHWQRAKMAGDAYLFGHRGAWPAKDERTIRKCREGVVVIESMRFVKRSAALDRLESAIDGLMTVGNETRGWLNRMRALAWEERERQAAVPEPAPSAIVSAAAIPGPLADALPELTEADVPPNYDEYAGSE